MVGSKLDVRPMRRLVSIAVLACLLASWMTADTAAATRRTARKTAASGPRDYRSRNFLVHTDLSPQEAKELLQRLETMLRLISTYWGKPNSQVIECFVVKDLDKWPKGVLPEEGVQHLRAGAGVTISQVTLLAGKPIAARAIVYAVADRGTPQHEAVHAYCAQTFGHTGPVWYSEGMAEMGNYWRDNDSSVQIEPGVLKYLQESEPKSLSEIVNATAFTGDSWQNYAWRWALCHLLANNPNYAPRFRPLGLGLLSGANVSFEQVYGAMAREISFEYLFFLNHIEQGYRVDLCSWDWKTKYRKLRGKAMVVAKIDANRGWQPSRLEVEQGRTYEFTTSGTWKTSKDGPETGADGGDEGRGRFVGIILNDRYELSEPFELGASGTFTGPADGKLLLRCQDGWGELADNTGTITVTLKPAAAGAADPAGKPAGEN